MPPLFIFLLLSVPRSSVNVASRLEGLNKRYGTVLICSEETCRLAGLQDFLFRPLEIVAVKGRDSSLTVVCGPHASLA